MELLIRFQGPRKDPGLDALLGRIPSFLCVGYPLAFVPSDRLEFVAVVEFKSCWLAKSVMGRTRNGLAELEAGSSSCYYTA